MKSTITLTLGAALITVCVSSGCATTRDFSYRTALYKMALEKQKHQLRLKCEMALRKQKQKLKSKCEMDMLHQQNGLKLKASIDSYRAMIASAKSELKWRRMVRPIILTMAKVHRSKDAIEALRQIDGTVREVTKILAEMKIELRKGLELQRRHKSLQ